MIRGVWHLEFMRTQIQHKHKKQEEFCITYNYLAESREPFESFVNDVVACKSVLFFIIAVDWLTDPWYQIICENLNLFTTKSNNLQTPTRHKIQGRRPAVWRVSWPAGLLFSFQTWKHSHIFHKPERDKAFCSWFSFPNVGATVLFLLYPYDCFFPLIFDREKNGTLGRPCSPGQKPQIVLLQLFLECWTCHCRRPQRKIDGKLVADPRGRTLSMYVPGASVKPLNSLMFFFRMWTRPCFLTSLLRCWHGREQQVDINGNCHWVLSLRCAIAQVVILSKGQHRT